MLRTYYELTKPERTYANILTAAAGFLLASKWHIDFVLFIATLGGMSLIVASACALNNYIDRGLDAKMPRTRKRALVQKVLPPSHVLTYAAILGVVGFAVLWFYVNTLVVVLGVVAYLDYIVLYGYTKRHTVHGTLAGTISGAMPIVAGYCAVTDHIDASAVILFLAMTFWQMAHFFAIAIYRLEDYKAGGIPVLPARKGIYRTKVQIMIYTAAFAITAVCLSVFGHAGYLYAAIMAFLGGVWVWRGSQGFRAGNDVVWARKMFFFSLKGLVFFSFWVAISGILP